MCMKYENEYLGCFDWMFFDEVYPEHSIQLLLKDWYGMKIVDVDGFGARLFELFETAHEDGTVRPMTEDEKEVSDQAAVSDSRAYLLNDEVIFYGLGCYDKKQ